jgi:DMSO reductase anchor subunit
LAIQSFGLLLAAFLIQFAGLLAERWFFFAQANHPQNLYYQTI